MTFWVGAYRVDLSRGRRVAPRRVGTVRYLDLGLVLVRVARHDLVEDLRRAGL